MAWLLLALVLAQADVSSDASSWTRAQWEAWIEKTDSEMIRLAPTHFHELPALIQRDLVTRGCTIPQVDDMTPPHNVISGYFHVPSRKDWAVLCSVGRTSRILIYQGGDVRASYEMPNSARPDRDWFQTGLGFSRAISVANAKTIVHYQKEFGGPEPPSLDHDGLEERFVEKASMIYYWHDGSWLELQGAD
jgi:hypothetical protein